MDEKKLALEHNLIMELIKTIEESGVTFGSALYALNRLTEWFVEEGEKYIKNTNIEFLSQSVINRADKISRRHCEVL